MENITKSAYLLIDMQNGFLDPSSPLCSTAAKATVPACARTMDIARQKGIPVFIVHRRYRADGSDVEAARHALWSGEDGRWRLAPKAPKHRRPCCRSRVIIPSRSPDSAPFSVRSWTLFCADWVCVLSSSREPPRPIASGPPATTHSHWIITSWCWRTAAPPARKSYSWSIWRI